MGANCFLFSKYRDVFCGRRHGFVFYRCVACTSPHCRRWGQRNPWLWRPSMCWNGCNRASLIERTFM
jgi:hypothetical protein